MAKEKTESKEERRARKEAKKASKLSEKAGVTKPEKKSSKKDKEALAEKAIKEIEAQAAEKTAAAAAAAAAAAVAADESETEVTKSTRPIGALVPFAHPLADEKIGKKCFKAVKKAAAQRTLKRGVKEVVKALRKSPNCGPSNSLAADAIPQGIVILAADISPMDVISHIPVLCEDHNIPYIFVTSRAELGMAGQTKRPTSVTMVSRDLPKKGDKKDTDEQEWAETFKGLVKIVTKEVPQLRR